MTIKDQVLGDLTMCDNCGCGQTETEESFEDRVKQVIESVRPALQSHGGDIELVAAEPDYTVKVRLQGACHGCPGAQMTMTMGVERILREKVPQVKQVIAVE